MNRSNFTRLMLALPRWQKRALVMVADAMLCLGATWIALVLRLDTLDVPLISIVVPSVVSLVLAIPLFAYFGLYRAIFRYSGWTALGAVGKAVAIYTILFAALFTGWGVEGVPRTLGILQSLLLLMGVAGTRVIARVWLGGFYRGHRRVAGLPRVLIYGAGSAGRQLAAGLNNSLEMIPLGFLDDDETLQGNTINGLPVFAPAALSKAVERFDITDVLLAIPSASRSRRNEVLASLREVSVRVRTVPGLVDLAYGRVELNDLRELDIEDLLGRDPVPPNDALLNRNVKGKVVLVTGAGGSIGSELCRQILRTGPKLLLLVESSEFALYAIHQELVSTLTELSFAQKPEVLPLLASVQDLRRMNEIIGTWKPHTVYHAAAYKHVPLVEHNPAEGVRNNVFGTLTTALAAAQHGVTHFVLISTDKAVRPTNIMGASKRLAELVLQALAQQCQAGAGPYSTCFSMVRFGNVLGSSGSVVPLFRQQIKDGGPITLTHGDITRYFMTIPEAAQLVIQSSAMASGGDVFVLDMGEPVRIIDLARRMVELSGLTVREEGAQDGDISIVITGLRPGEKLYEELLIGDNPEPTQHARIMKAHEAHVPWDSLDPALQSLRQMLDSNDVEGIRQSLLSLVSGFKPDERVVDWVFLEQHHHAA